VPQWCVKTYNIKAQYSFNGYVVDKIKCTESCAQIELRFDKRIPPRWSLSQWLGFFETSLKKWCPARIPHLPNLK